VQRIVRDKISSRDREKLYELSEDFKRFMRSKR